jgi:hypothetical protein
MMLQPGPLGPVSQQGSTHGTAAAQGRGGVGRAQDKWASVRGTWYGSDAVRTPLPPPTSSRLGGVWGRRRLSRGAPFETVCGRVACSSLPQVSSWAAVRCVGVRVDDEGEGPRGAGRGRGSEVFSCKSPA